MSSRERGGRSQRLALVSIGAWYAFSISIIFYNKCAAANIPPPRCRAHARAPRPPHRTAPRRAARAPCARARASRALAAGG
jgi:hypothetical protein